MKRKKDPTLLAKELREEFKARSLNPSEISKLLNINQSQIHRNLKDGPKTVNKTIMQLCSYLNIEYMEKAPDPRESNALMSALAELWDGTDNHARKIAAVIFALKRARV